jgi:Flp pilus assembly protein TadG
MCKRPGVPLNDGMLERAGLRPETRDGGGGRRLSRQRGQSLVEFSVVLPVLLCIVGVVIDASRVYQAWTNLESATRDAAQYLATSDIDPSSGNYTTQGSNSDSKAIYILNTATGYTFTRSPSQGALTNCSAPQATTTYTANTSSGSGGSTSNPAGTARVIACLSFKTLFSYPFLTNNGAWVVKSDRTYTILVGR